MPHLSPMCWPFLFFLCWSLLLLSISCLWWLQLPRFPTPPSTPKHTPFTPWDWT